METIFANTLMLALDWGHFIFGDHDPRFLLMVGFRTMVMFVVILVGLRLMGKRGVTQLSVFELGVIVGLGSAAGDPMFYKDVGLFSAILVFIVVIAFYHLLKYIVSRNEKMERFVEGHSTELLIDGKMLVEHIRKETLSRQEFFMQLRTSNVSHLGR